MEVNKEAAQQANDSAEAAAISARTWTIITSLVGALAALFIGLLLTRSIVHRLGKVVAAANVIAQQDLVSLAGLADALAAGDSSRSLTLKSNELDAASADKIGDLARSFYNGDFNLIKNNLNTCMDAINSLKSDLGQLIQG